MAVIKFLTDKGTVSVKARGEIKNQTAQMLVDRIAGAQITAKGVTIEVGTDMNTGNPIYVIIDPTVTMSLEVKPKVAKAKDKVAVEVPNLYE